MKVNVESSKLLKPSYKNNANAPPSTLQVTPLSVFDKLAIDFHIATVFAFRPPTPPTSHLVSCLADVLSEYREWAGRFAEDAAGNPVILLNDAGMRLVEASVDSSIVSQLPLEPSPELLLLHPSTGEEVEELTQIQLTRFACGSLAVGFTMNHRVADGHSAGMFFTAWGLACRSLPFPTPVRDRSTFFVPRSPPQFTFEHRGVEYKTKKKSCAETSMDDITLLKLHYTPEFLTELKTKAAAGGSRSYTRFEALVGHLWREMTRARNLDPKETTTLHASVNGRWRMSPRIPAEYFGNLVLWARPDATVGELVGGSLQHAAELIHRSVAKMDDEYYRSFIDFATSGAVEEEGLVPTVEERSTCPSIEVDSWARLSFSELDLGGGRPFLFMPSSIPIEGLLLLVPSFDDDGSIEAFLTVFTKNAAAFKELCYSLD